MYYSFKFITFIYFTAALISAFSLFAGFHFGTYIFNPMLLPILILYIFAKFKNLDHPILPLLIVALFFSFLGDILSMVDFEKKLFTLLAICTFTVAQVCYGALYYYSSSYRPSNQIKWSQRWPEFSCIVILGITTLFIYPHLEDFKIPGLIYSFVTSITIVLAVNRRFHVSFRSFATVFIGVICFFISDVLVGLYMTSENSIRFGGTDFIYSIGHWLVVRGMCFQIMDESPQEKLLTPQ